ncbi:MAG: Npun_F5749 family FMN-dependent PPOX-type flavoprotein [Cyanobacteria bacterium P01_G01_bin.49]
MTLQLAPWRTILSRALHRNRSKPHSRYFQLATVKPDGKAANRTVVFRGFLDNTNQLQIITDIRSHKIIDIGHQPWGEICWYFSKTREQFRITGQLTIIDETHFKQTARINVWKKLSDQARQQFTWPIPGKPYSNNQEDFLNVSPSEDHPLKNFCLLLFEPQKVDYLALQDTPHHRQLYYLDHQQDWQTQVTNP